MISLRLFGRCRIYHDPVCPVLKGKAAIGWEALYRRIDLVIERRLKGAELARRMKGWWTVDPQPVIDLVEEHGRLIVDDEGRLAVELADDKAAAELSRCLEQAFGEQITLVP